MKRSHTTAAVLALVVLVALVFSGTLDHPFIGVDDDHRIFENPALTEPLSWDAVPWAFSRDLGRLYVQPLTWLVFRANVAAFGASPRVFHVESVAAHALVVALLFLLLARLTRRPVASFVASAIFAVHPLVVEPVAWAVELNALLASALGLLALHAYVGFARSPSLLRYAPVVVAYVASLLAKPWLFGLPVAMLALDLWPLRRWGQTEPGGPPTPVRRLLVEKLPLLAAGAAWALWAMGRMEPPGAEGSPTAGRSLALRLAHAPVAVARYLGKLFAPVDLAIDYPFPDHVPAWQTLGALAVCAALTYAVYRAREDAPSLAAGWGWFLALVAPTLGVVQAGKWPAIADRFAYLPMAGIVVGLVFAAAEPLLGRHTSARWGALAGAGAAVVLLGVAARAQLELWRDPVTLLAHSEAVAPGSPVVEFNLASELGRRGRFGEAEVILRRLVERQDRSDTRNQLGNVLLLTGRAAEASAQYERAVALDPRNAEALYNLANALQAQGRSGEARVRFEQFVEVAPPWLDRVKQQVQQALGRSPAPP